MFSCLILPLADQNDGKTGVPTRGNTAYCIGHGRSYLNGAAESKRHLRLGRPLAPSGDSDLGVTCCPVLHTALFVWNANTNEPVRPVIHKLSEGHERCRLKPHDG